MTEVTPKLKVFLCHASQDKPLVRELDLRLKAQGVDTWLDELNILPGQDWDDEIMRAVEDAHIVLICLSTNSVSKTGYVQKELRRALDLSQLQPDGAIFIIPVRLDECAVPKTLRRWQWVDLFEPNGFERLTSALKLHSKRIGIPYSNHLELFESIRRAVEKEQIKDVVRTLQSIDLIGLPQEQLEELFWALVLAKTKLDKESESHEICLRILSACLGRLRLSRPQDPILRWVEISARSEYAAKLIRSEEFEEAVAQLEPVLAVDLIDNASGDMKNTLSVAHLAYCKALEHLGRFDVVIKFLSETASKWLAKADSFVTWAVLAAAQASCLAKTGNSTQALSAIHQIVELSHGQNAEIQQEGLGRAAGYLWKINNYELAIPLFSGALKSTSPPETKESEERVANLYSYLAECQRKNGNFEDAINTCEDMFNRFSKPDTPEIEEYIAWCMTELQRSHRGLENFDEAIAVSDKCYQQFKNSQSSGAREFAAWCYGEKGQSATNSKEFEIALEYFEDFLSHFDPVRTLNENAIQYDFQVSYVLGEKARCLGLMGRFEEAVLTCDECIKRFTTHSDKDVEFEVAWCLVEKALNLRRLGRFSEAELTYRKVIDAYANENRDDFRKEVRASMDGRGFCALGGAKLAVLKGQNEVALAHMDNAEIIFSAANEVSFKADSLFGLAELASLRKEPLRFHYYLNEACRIGGKDWQQEMVDEVAHRIIGGQGKWIDALDALGKLSDQVFRLD